MSLSYISNIYNIILSIEPPHSEPIRPELCLSCICSALSERRPPFSFMVPPGQGGEEPENEEPTV